MAVSILDKIIASKEDQAKQDFDPNEVIASLLKKLTTKEADVLQRRFGLNGTAEETLEAIGASYNVTRERVRQIENLAIQKLQEDPNFSQIMKPAEHVLSSVMEEHGGLMTTEYLLDELFPGMRSVALDRSVHFLLAELINYRFEAVGPNEEFKISWRLKTANVEYIKTIIAAVVQLVQTAGQPQSLDQLWSDMNQPSLTLKMLEAYVISSQALAANPFGEYGLAQWGSVLPRRMNDKIYVVLKKVGKPMHFVDIARKISEVFKKEAYPPTVHNELILNTHYVLVGRGIYALKEWGYERGVVADVIDHILEEKKQPLTRDQIVDEVLEQRLVKRNTIHLALTNKQRFTRLPDGRYIKAII